MATNMPEKVENSCGISPHVKTNGIDICGDVQTNIIRSDLGCFMRVTNELHKEQTATIHPLHPTCSGGEHYFSVFDSPDLGLMKGSKSQKHFIIKGDSCRVVTDLETDKGAKVSKLHKDCQGGDFYLATNWNQVFGTSYVFIIIFAEDWTFRVVSDLTTGKPSDSLAVASHVTVDVKNPIKSLKKIKSLTANPLEVVSKMAQSKSVDGVNKLHENCRGGLYYWATKASYGPMCYYIIKGMNEWGLVIHYTHDLQTDEDGHDETIIPSICNFLPGGLEVSMGTPTGRWDRIKTIDNSHKTVPLVWENRVSKKVGYAKHLTESLKTNWNVSTSYSAEVSASCTYKVVMTAACKHTFSTKLSTGGEAMNVSKEDWSEEHTVEESLLLTIPPSETMYIWQYVIGFQSKDEFHDVLYSKHLKMTDTSTVPTDAP